MFPMNYQQARATGVACVFLLTCLAATVLLRAQDKPKSGLTIDVPAKRLTIDCVVAPRKLEKLSEIYPIEVIATHPAPKGQKAHETVVTFDVAPSDVHKALESLGLKPGTPAKGEAAKAVGPEVKVFLEIPAAGGLPKKLAIEKTLVDRKTGKSLPPLKWFFTGSVMKQPDPNKPEKVYGADSTGTLISLFPVTDETVLQTNLTMKDEPLIKLDTAKDVLPAVGTAVKLVIEVK
ncbi:MAG: hypothetical protein HZA46_12035 [Planctomycetales bacterium]|nr:hypothetical protein [Planctomycetales bacterium]